MTAVTRCDRGPDKTGLSSIFMRGGELETLMGHFYEIVETFCNGGFMDRYLGRYSEHLYGILRIITGLLFACHGAQKLLGWPGGAPHASGALFLAAGLIELLGGSMIAIGLGTSFVAFIASGEMAVAYFKAHAPGGLLPIVNRGELAVVYCFIFLYMAARGSGAFSLGGLTHKR